MPISTRTTQSFNVQTLDPQGYSVNSVTTLLSLTMLQGANITRLVVSSSSNFVNQPADLKIRFTTPIPLKGQEMLYIELPQEVTIQFNRIQCYGDGAGILAALLSCTVNGQFVTVTIIPKSSSTGIQEKAQLEIRLSQVLNPGSSKMTGEFQVQIREKQGFIMA